MVIYIVDKRKEIKIQKRLKEYRQYLNEKKIDFLIHINHELRTPLTLIYAPLKRLIDKKEYKGSPQYLMSQLQLISNQAQHMREIVDMVLDWNSMEAGYSKLKVQRCKLDGWIADIVKDFTDEAKEKGISIKLQMDTDIEEIWLDRQKCHTVLSNLLMNALKFSMPESCITINTRRLENKVRISVVDEGAGIQDSDNTGNKERGGGLRTLDGNGGGRNATCQEATAGITYKQKGTKYTALTDFEIFKLHEFSYTHSRINSDMGEKQIIFIYIQHHDRLLKR